MNRDRMESLDVLRGLAALMVAINHSFLVLNIGGVGDLFARKLFEVMETEAKIAQVIIWWSNGSFFVMVFFVLSGVLLSRSYEKLGKETGGMLVFYTKRVFRIYPVYFLMSMFAGVMWMGDYFPVNLENSGEWWRWWYGGSLSLREFLAHLLFIKPGLSGVSWTMRIEVLGSLLMPVLFFAGKRASRWGDVMVLSLIYLLAVKLGKIELVLLIGFYLGVVVEKWKGLFVVGRRIWGRWPVVLKILAVGLFMAVRYWWKGELVWMIEAVGAFLVVGSLIYGSQNIQGGVLAKVGVISYSFYLWHFLVLYMVTPLVLNLIGGGLMGLAANALLCVVITIVVAMISYVVVERPMMILGSRVFSKRSLGS